MELEFLSGCFPEDCPRVYEADQEMVVLARKVTDPAWITQARPGADEVLGTVPREVFLEAALKMLAREEAHAPLSREEFRALADAARGSVFRLETLQRYVIPGEAEDLDAFLQGRPQPNSKRRLEPWLQRLRESIAAGKRWQRVHVVTYPLSDYLRFELTGYQEGVAAGEDIRIADRDAHRDLDQLTQDFWLFDDQIAVMMRYDADGRFLGYERADTPGDLTRCRQQRDLALAHATPLREYLDGRP